MSKNKKVGYKNPPKEHQFKKGTSGNPKGRPPNSSKFRFKTDLLEILIDVAREEVPIKINGEMQTLSTIKAITKLLAVKALNGDRHCMKLFLAMIDKATIEEKKDYEELLNVLKGLAIDIDLAKDEDIEAKGLNRSTLYKLFKSLEGYKISRYDN